MDEHSRGADGGDLDTDDLIAYALAEGVSYREAARLARVSAKTVQRRMAEPAFARRVATERSARVGEITGLLGELGRKAIGILDDAMAPDEPTRTKLVAASSSLKYLKEFRNAAGLEERVAEMEALVGEFQDRQGDSS